MVMKIKVTWNHLCLKIWKLLVEEFSKTVLNCSKWSSAFMLSFIAQFVVISGDIFRKVWHATVQDGIEIYSGEASTQKSAVTHAGTVFVPRDLDLRPFDPKIKSDFQDSRWNISVSSLVIVAALGFEISSRKDRQTDRQTNGNDTPTPGTSVGVGNSVTYSCWWICWKPFYCCCAKFKRILYRRIFLYCKILLSKLTCLYQFVLSQNNRSVT